MRFLILSLLLLLTFQMSAGLARIPPSHIRGNNAAGGRPEKMNLDYYVNGERPSQLSLRVFEQKDFKEMYVSPMVLSV
jgi:hypothetical protein